MKLEIHYTKSFKKSLKRVRQYPGFKIQKFRNVIELLQCGAVLPVQYRDHGLTGDMAGYRECHLAPDILLIYQIDNEILTLVLTNIGTHASLFDK